jgi:hypothetical protein
LDHFCRSDTHTQSLFGRYVNSDEEDDKVLEAMDDWHQEFDEMVQAILLDELVELEDEEEVEDNN